MKKVVSPDLRLDKFKNWLDSKKKQGSKKKKQLKRRVKRRKLLNSSLRIKKDLLG